MSAEHPTPEEEGAGLNPTGSDSETIRRGEELYRMLAGQLPNVAVVVFDRDMEVLIAEGEALMSHGITDRQAEGRPLRDVMDLATYEALEELYRAALDGERRQLEQSSPDGNACFRVIGKPMVGDEGEVWAGLAMAQDITDLRSSEKALRKQSKRLTVLAERDGLTQLPNRGLLQDRLEHALTRAKRDKGLLALLFVDLDRFKHVNDRFGHEAGDTVLRTLGARLAAAVRAGDTVARIGGDEFVILVDGVRRGDEALAAIERVQRALAPVVEIAGSEIELTASIGVALSPDDGIDGDALLAAADRAMYQAKADGGNRHRFFDPTMHERALERLRIETAMREGIQRDQFVLQYQPAVELQTGRVASVEALIRWNHPERGQLLAGEFIPIAEETGFAAEITEWVLEQACKQARIWEHAGIAPLRVAINSCSRELGGGLSLMIKKALAATGLRPEALEIEITERFLGEDDDVRDEMLAEIKGLGVYIALDDFGTGYSSLARLQSFPVDVIKIDRTFIEELDRSTAIAKTIIALAGNLGVRVIAEGVEKEPQLAWLKDSGCDAASGFLVCPPLPPEELTPWLVSAQAS